MRPNGCRPSRSEPLPAGVVDAHRDRGPGFVDRPVATGSGTRSSVWSWSDRWSFWWSKGLGSALDFYLPADQAVAQRATLGNQTFNLEGVVEPGSIHHTRAGVDFVVTAGSTNVQVINSGSPPSSSSRTSR